MAIFNFFYKNGNFRNFLKTKSDPKYSPKRTIF